MKADANFTTNWRGAFMAYAPIVLWVCVIFYLSSPSGSMAETSRIIGPLLKFLVPSISDETVQDVHGYIRKAAHLTEYAILAFLTLLALSRSLIDRLYRFRFLLPIVFVALIASIDEFNQSFEASRTGSVRDVLLDITGGVLMIALLWLIKWPRPPKSQQQHSDRS